jgi:hypothetical protein
LTSGIEKDSKKLPFIVASPDERPLDRRCVGDRDEAQARAGELAKGRELDSDADAGGDEAELRVEDGNDLRDYATEAAGGEESRFPVDRSAWRYEREFDQIVQWELASLGQGVILGKDCDPRLGEKRLDGQGALVSQPRFDCCEPDVQALLAQGVCLLLRTEGGEPEGHVRYAASEEAQQSGEVGVVGPRVGSNGDVAVFDRSCPARGRYCSMHLVESDLGLLQELDACGSKADRATRAIEELDPKLGLESAYVSAQMGLGYLKPRCGTAEMPLFRHGDERVKEAELNQHTRYGIELSIS